MTILTQSITPSWLISPDVALQVTSAGDHLNKVVRITAVAAEQDIDNDQIPDWLHIHRDVALVDETTGDVVLVGGRPVTGRMPSTGLYIQNLQSKVENGITLTPEMQIDNWYADKVAEAVPWILNKESALHAVLRIPTGE